MTNDLISREALLKEIDLAPDEWAKGRTISAIIADAPAVDAAPVVHGRWEQYPGPSDLRCTYCKAEFDKSKMPLARNYCTHCGAKMDEAEIGHRKNEDQAQT